MLAHSQPSDRDARLAALPPALSHQNLTAAIDQTLNELEQAGILYFYSLFNETTTTITAATPDSAFVLPLYHLPKPISATMASIRAEFGHNTENFRFFGIQLTQSLFKDDSQLAPFHDGTLARIVGSLQRWRKLDASMIEISRDSVGEPQFGNSFVEFRWFVSHRLVEILAKEMRRIDEARKQQQRRQAAGNNVNIPGEDESSDAQLLIGDIEREFQHRMDDIDAMEEEHDEQGEPAQPNQVLSVHVAISRGSHNKSGLLRVLVWNGEDAAAENVTKDLGLALLWFIRQAAALPLKHKVLCPSCIVDSSSNDLVRLFFFFFFFFLFFLFCS
jgi:hypothetical protein